MSTTTLSASTGGTDPGVDPPGKRPLWVDFTSMGGAVIGTVIALLQLLKDGPKGAIVAGVMTAALGAFVLARARQHHQVVAAIVALALTLGGVGLAGAGIDRALNPDDVQPPNRVVAVSPTIRFAKPTNGQTVDRTVTVSGTANGAVDKHVWAFVELQDGRRYFGSKCDPGKVGQNGDWVANELNVGQPGDAGTPFTLGALLVDDADHRTIEGLCSRNELSGKKSSAIPITPLAETTIRVQRM